MGYKKMAGSNVDVSLDELIKKNTSPKKRTLKKKGNPVGKSKKVKGTQGPIGRAHQLLKCYVNQPNQEKTQKELKTLRHVVDLLEGVIKKKKEKKLGKKVTGNLFPPSTAEIFRNPPQN